jgi:hypothetical protein
VNPADQVPLPYEMRRATVTMLLLVSISGPSAAVPVGAGTAQQAARPAADVEHGIGIHHQREVEGIARAQPFNRS